jgi:glycosyltransferase involved in cell wall biosynthesis
MTRQIIGISLVRNEDLYLRQVITNVAAFCDRIIILDNCSTDNTSQEIMHLKSCFPHVETHRINDYRESHSHISAYAGTDTWAFGIDGDELYDPHGLERFRSELLLGKFDGHWAIFGNVVNCVELKLSEKKATGYLSPPSRSMTKLFNFGALVSWEGRYERFHGGNKQFRTGFDESQRYSLHEHTSWDASFFRCLHLCFVRRSSGELSGKLSRLQPDEKPNWLKRMDRLGIGWLFARIIQEKRSPWKDERYRRGALVTVDAAPFFPNLVY